MKKIFFIIGILLIWFKLSSAQSLPVGTLGLDDYYRREQLLGKVDSNISFTVRPVISGVTVPGRDIFFPDSNVEAGHAKRSGYFADGKGFFRLLPLTLQQQFNTHHPYGWNDGPIIPAKGYQTMVSGGFYLSYKFLSVQLRPEFVYAANPAFSGFVGVKRTNSELAAYYSYYNDTDQPERFGNGAYTKAFLGQTSIRLNFDPVSFGVSNENLWWGPGIRNSLMMSNNAPGFKHITFNTTRPILSFLGAFEGQVVVGKLTGTGLPPLSVTRSGTGKNLYDIKSSDWRYFSGFNINYHPKWVPGFTLGFTRTFQAYNKDVNTLAEYVPFFFPFQKKNTNDGDPIPRDQHTSVYARWLFKKVQAEVYFEYGLNDNSYDYRDFIGSPDHSRAYLFGIRKMMPIAGKTDEHILFGAEITQISQSPDRLIRPSIGWYTHFQIRHGYTNMGQLLGAGDGGNMQSVDISWVSGIRQIGFTFERLQHNGDVTDRLFSNINGNSRRWVDLALGLQSEWSCRNIIFDARLKAIKSLNYEWILKNYTPDSYYVPNNTVYNLQAQLGITYRF